MPARSSPRSRQNKREKGQKPFGRVPFGLLEAACAASARLRSTSLGGGLCQLGGFLGLAFQPCQVLGLVRGKVVLLGRVLLGRRRRRLLLLLRRWGHALGERALWLWRRRRRRLLLLLLLRRRRRRGHGPWGACPLALAEEAEAPAAAAAAVPALPFHPPARRRSCSQSRQSSCPQDGGQAAAALQSSCSTGPYSP